MSLEHVAGRDVGKVMLYALSTCIWCKKTKEYLSSKNVAFDYGKTSWTEKQGDRWLVVEANKESLEALPDFDRSAYDPAPATAAAGAETAPSVTPATDTAANTEVQPDAAAPAAPTGGMVAETE